MQSGAGKGVDLVIDTLLPTDWPQVRAIYQEGIATGEATFERAVPAWDAWDKGALALLPVGCPARRGGAGLGCVVTRLDPRGRSMRGWPRSASTWVNATVDKELASCC